MKIHPPEQETKQNMVQDTLDITNRLHVALKQAHLKKKVHNLLADAQVEIVALRVRSHHQIAEALQAHFRVWPNGMDVKFHPREDGIQVLVSYGPATWRLHMLPRVALLNGALEWVRKHVLPLAELIKDDLIHVTCGSVGNLKDTGQ